MVKLIRRKDVRANVNFFCENSSIHTLNFLTMKNVSSFERIVWALINVGLVITTIILMKHLWRGYLNEATIVTLESANYPIEKVKFPGVSICNLNKISKERAHRFAKFISNKKSFTNNRSALLEDIKLLGNLYDFDTYGQERFTYFQDILDKYQYDTIGSDPTISLISKLSPSCEDILQKCKWSGIYYPCEELFLTRMTFEGPCCVFNYIRPSIRKLLWNNAREVPNKSESPQGPGMENGLEVTLNNKLDDYFCTTRNFVGFNVHIFYSDDYPDVQSGSLTEIVVDAGMYTHIPLDIDVIESSPEMETLPVNLRKCKFEKDDITLFGAYRQSDCFVECRSKSMLALCDCIPFTLPVDPDPSEDEVRICTLSDIPCLNKHKVKWSRYYPYDTDTTGLEQELYDSIRCPNCLPDCNSVKYNVYTNYASLSSKLGENDITVVNIFVNKAFANLYKLDLTNTWFEILSSFGGVLSLLMGLSVISVIEIFIFLCRITFCYIYKFSKK